MVETYGLPALAQIEFFGDDSRKLAQWLAENTGKTDVSSLIFGRFLDGSMGMNIRPITLAELSIYAGLPHSVLSAILKGTVPIKLIGDLLPQLAAGLELELTYMEMLLSDAIHMASSPKNTPQQ